eukprot:1424961-Pyramimonas_sp.AAC.1
MRIQLSPKLATSWGSTSAIEVPKKGPPDPTDRGPLSSSSSSTSSPLLFLPPAPRPPSSSLGLAA